MAFEFHNIRLESHGYNIVLSVALKISRQTHIVVTDKESNSSISRVTFLQKGACSPLSVNAHSELPDDAVGAGLFYAIAIEGAKQVTKDMVARFGYIERLHREYPSEKSNDSFIGKSDKASSCLGAWGGNLSVPADIFKKVWYDERFDGCWGAEDADLTKRMMEAGAKFEWVASSQMYHLEHPVRTYSRLARGRKIFKQ